MNFLPKFKSQRVGSRRRSCEGRLIKTCFPRTFQCANWDVIFQGRRIYIRANKQRGRTSDERSWYIECESERNVKIHARRHVIASRRRSLESWNANRLLGKMSKCHSREKRRGRYLRELAYCVAITRLARTTIFIANDSHLTIVTQPSKGRFRRNFSDKFQWSLYPSTSSFRKVSYFYLFLTSKALRCAIRLHSPVLCIFFILVYTSFFKWCYFLIEINKKKSSALPFSIFVY